MGATERQASGDTSGMTGVSGPSASDTATAHEHAQAEMEARERHVDAGLSGATGVSEPFASDTTTAPEHAQDEMEARERQVGADTSGMTSVSGPFASDTTTGHECAQDEMEARERQVGADTSRTTSVSGPSASDTTTGHEHAQDEMEAREKQAGAGPCGMIGVSEPSASIIITSHEHAQTTDIIMEVEDPLPVEVSVAAMPERLEEDNITSYRSCILHCIAALLIPVLNAGNTIISKKAITEGMRMRFAVYSCYRNAIAMTVLLPLVLCNSSVIGQNLLSASETPATFSAIMLGVSPALTFLASWIFRLESVMIKERRSQAKLLGTAVVTAGAISVGLKSGKTITLFSTSDGGRHETIKHQLREDWVRGPLFVVLALLCSVSYNIILGKIVKGYPSPLAITAFISTVGAILNLGVALVLERGRGISWFVDFNIQMLAYFYGCDRDSSYNSWIDCFDLGQKWPSSTLQMKQSPTLLHRWMHKA
ncbi:hypothetical protein L1049_027227 [Liquidambar formosana]|uniref:EamA domain-containing protein n=1 Tax=Liquidambar formosana TaxID=63359 RepID=A0AAP0N3L5_LIQFO